jgi:hypothetical protein
LKLQDFPKLDSLFLRFSAECATTKENPWGDEGPETVERRLEILHIVFGTIAKINAIPERKIRRLSIGTLQNVVDDEWFESGEFKSVLSGLEELHVSVCTELNHASPENSITKAAVHRFWPRLHRNSFSPLRLNSLL